MSRPLFKLWKDKYSFTSEERARVDFKKAEMLAKDKVEFQRDIDRYWVIVRDVAKGLCVGWGAYDTGTLHDSIRIEEAGGGFGMAFEVVALAGGGIDITRMIVAGGGHFVNPKTGRICDYAQAVHDGVPSRGRPPRPFLTTAIDMCDAELQRIMMKYIDKLTKAVSD